jgi:hypothetical protein
MLNGTGTITGNVSNAGTVSPGLSPGCLDITGNYTQTASGILNLELGGGEPCTGFDRLAVGGVAALAGTLNTTLINSFNPPNGTTFRLLTYGSRTGTFSTVNGPFTPNYGATSLDATRTGGSDSVMVTTTADSGAGSLRQAILDANSFRGVQTITFNITGTGVQTIALTSALPTITDAVLIDGYTQPGASANTLAVGNNAVLLIQLSGNGAAFDGLTVTAANSVIRGLSSTASTVAQVTSASTSSARALRATALRAVSSAPIAPARLPSRTTSASASATVPSIT